MTNVMAKTCSCSSQFAANTRTQFRAFLEDEHSFLFNIPLPNSTPSTTGGFVIDEMPHDFVGQLHAGAWKEIANDSISRQSSNDLKYGNNSDHRIYRVTHW